MSVPAKLTSFAAALLLVFAAAFGVGRAVGDPSSTDTPPAPTHQGPHDPEAGP